MKLPRRDFLKPGGVIPTTESYAASISLAESSPATSAFYEAMPNRHTNRAAFGILIVPDSLNFTHHLKCGQVWQRIHL